MGAPKQTSHKNLLRRSEALFLQFLSIRGSEDLTGRRGADLGSFRSVFVWGRARDEGQVGDVQEDIE